VVEELSEWGVVGSLVQSNRAEYQTMGLSRLHLVNEKNATINGKPYRDPAAPAASSPPRKIIGQATGPLATYADGPFTVVLGTSESDAWKNDNLALAQAFVVAWANHAQGHLHPVIDSDIVDDGPAGRHLVLIGNVRSNALLARLAPRLGLPVTWDARSFRVGENEFLRAERRSFALCWPHPAKDGRLLVILDGQPSWSVSDLPLAGLPDLFIGGKRIEDPPALLRSFDNLWR
jgi:electron transfer flavoprotein alpha subunit